MSDRPASTSQIGYARNLLERCGYGERVTVAWAPLLRKLNMMRPGIGTEASRWVATLSSRDASRLIEALKEEA